MGVAARFLREDFRKPLIAKCGEYVGPADNAMVSISCIQANDDGEEKALSGLAVYAKFNEKNLTNPSVSICRMEIVLQKRMYHFTQFGNEYIQMNTNFVDRIRLRGEWKNEWYCFHSYRFFVGYCCLCSFGCFHLDKKVGH